jgi:pimeloyl-ACP methyl ester carboxylesterase
MTSTSVATALSTDGISVRYEVRGRGALALVFVHGWSCDRRYWNAQMDYFADRHQVVAVDLAGHGESGLGRKAWTMPCFGADVVAVVKQLGLRRMLLIGHSMGGDVIVEAALRLRGRVTGLVWVDTYNSLDETESDDRIEEFIAPFRADFVTSTRDFVTRMFLPGSDPDLVEWVAADMSSAPPEAALDAIKYAVANEPAAVAGLRDAAVPVTAINPDYRQTDVESMKRHGVRVVLMSGVGHFLMMEDPASFNRVLAQTIECLEAEQHRS